MHRGDGRACASATRCRRSGRRRGSGASGTGPLGRPWREIAFHLVHFPAPSTSVDEAAWGGSLALAGLPAYATRSPGDSAKFWLLRDHVGPGRVAVAPASAPPGLAVVAAVGHDRARPARAGPRPARCSGRAREPRSTPPRWTRPETSRRRPSTAPRPNGVGSSAISTTVPSSAWSRWRPTSGGEREARPPIPRRAELVVARPRGGQGGAQGDPRSRSRHPSGDPRG